MIGCESSFGYFGSGFVPIPPNIPLVITSSGGGKYESEYIHYSMDELYNIVKDVKDLTLPEIPEEIMKMDIILKEANPNLVEKGRTESIDQALRGGAPRTFSVDSVDYTNMVVGYMGEEVSEVLRKQRRRHKKRRS